jgi:Rab proteins geranylgeranyltransferase component A
MCHTDLIHLSTLCESGAQKDLQQFLETFFREDFADNDENESKPTIVYSAFFEVPISRKNFDYISKQQGPIFKCCGPFLELDYKESIRQSRLLFAKMYPDEEFLPKAPEPEEIIIGDEDISNAAINLGALADLVPENEQKEENS